MKSEPESLSSGGQSRAEATREVLRTFVRISDWALKVQPRTLDALLAATSVRELCVGEVLCHQGVVPGYWYGIMSGLLRQDALCNDGSPASLSVGPMGTWFGEGALLLGEVRRYEVCAMRESRVACMRASAFMSAFNEDRSFNMAISELLSARLHLFMEMFADQRRLNVEQRVARILVSMVGQGRHGLHLQIDVTQDELAQLAGVSRQRVHKALHILHTRGLLELAYSSIAVLDVAGLGSAC